MCVSVHTSASGTHSSQKSTGCPAPGVMIGCKSSHKYWEWPSPNKQTKPSLRSQIY